MSGLLALVRDFFVAPAGTASRGRAVPPPAACAAVLGRPPEVGAAAPALALALARRQGGGCAVVCTWGVGNAATPRLPAGGAARRLALRLDARGLAADASGRLVRVRLPDDPGAAAAGAERAAGAACPVVLGLAGPRDEAVDRLLTAQDVVVLAHPAAAEPALARAAEASHAELPVPVIACRLPSAGPLRALAAAGLLAPPALTEALLPALEVVR
jgi:hypothetical protein